MARVFDVIVVGAGAAGLTAARELSRSGLAIALLEARPRVGGRILTRHDPAWPVPLELGAEFLHGTASTTRAVAAEARLPLIRLADRHDWMRDGRRGPRTDVWGEFNRVRRLVPRGGPDRSLASFLASRKGLRPRTRRLVRLLVEGYDAAPIDDVSAQSLALPAGSEQDHGQARLRDGQDALLQWLQAGLDPDRVTLRLGVMVEEVEWRPGRVEVLVRSTTEAGHGPERRHASASDARGGRRDAIHARCLVLTAPIAVLQAEDGPGAIRFTPPLGRAARALAAIGMGHVLKLVLRLRRPLWDEDTGFLHDGRSVFPTWWTQSPVHVPVITGWLGGPRARQLRARGENAVLSAAMHSLGSILGRRVEREVEAWAWHDWSADPWSRGAYSYLRVGGLEAQRVLSRGIAGTIHFAGEALDPEESGTVDGALASGARTAQQVEKGLR